MDFELSDEQKAWRQEVKDFALQNASDELREEVSLAELNGPGPLFKAWMQKLSAKGWLGLSWPKEYGGVGRGYIDEWLMFDEFWYYGIWKNNAGLSMIGPTIIRFASEEMKEEWLPRIITGQYEFALGYSEPNAGSDLASLQTRAVRDGDEFVINGQKLWNSSAHFASHQWLAVRTDPSAPKHKGISILIFPMNLPGITIRPLWTWGDRRTNEVFFDNVRVPKTSLVGELNKGWQYATAALAFERIVIIHNGDIRRMVEGLVRFTKETEVNGRPLAADSHVRNQLANLATDIEVDRLFALRACWIVDNGRVPSHEASTFKLFNSELQGRVGDIGMQIMGRYGQLKTGSKWVPLRGEIEWIYRNSSVYRFGGGASETQRDLIARRAFGLGR